MPPPLSWDNKKLNLKKCLDVFIQKESEFSRRVVTVNETWIQHYNPETKRQFKQKGLPKRKCYKESQKHYTDRKGWGFLFLLECTRNKRSAFQSNTGIKNEKILNRSQQRKDAMNFDFLVNMV